MKKDDLVRACNKLRTSDLTVSDEVIDYIYNAALKHLDESNELTQPLIEFVDGYIIDLREVSHVTTIKGDAAYRRYDIHLKSGREVEVYHSRRDMRYMPREEFIERWKAVVQN